MSTARKLRANANDALAAGRSVFKVTIEDVTCSLAGGTDSEAELAEVLFAVTEAAVKTGHAGYAILLDEAQVVRDDLDRDGEHPLPMLVATVNALQEAEVPIALVLCGLPTMKANLQKARTYSERMFKAEQIGALDGNPGPARDAFIVPRQATSITADETLIARVLDEVEGFLFFIQLWGAELWEAAFDSGRSRFTEQMLDAIEEQIYHRLDEEFYSGRIETLTPSEQDVLMLSAKCPYPPLKTSDIRNHSDKSNGNINVLMGRLTDQGVLCRTQKGQYEYTAPKFAEFLRRRAAGLAGP